MFSAKVCFVLGSRVWVTGIDVETHDSCDRKIYSLGHLNCSVDPSTFFIFFEHRSASVVNVSPKAMSLARVFLLSPERSQ